MEAAGEPTGWATVCEADRLGLLKKGWGTMTAIARKVQIGTAACAIAVAAALTPAAVAQADEINNVSGPGTFVIFQNSGSFDNVNFVFVTGQLGPYSSISA
jgi:hypothetical protein